MTQAGIARYPIAPLRDRNHGTGFERFCDDGWMPSWLMSLFGGDGEVDAADYRYYRVGIDAALDDVYFYDYDMGSWSDGTSVREIDRVMP